MSSYKSRYEKERSSKGLKIIALLFIVAAGLVLFSKFYLKRINDGLKTEVKQLKEKKEALSGEVQELEKSYGEVEKSYNNLMTKLNQNK